MFLQDSILLFQARMAILVARASLTASYTKSLRRNSIPSSEITVFRQKNNFWDLGFVLVDLESVIFI